MRHKVQTSIPDIWHEFKDGTARYITAVERDCRDPNSPFAHAVDRPPCLDHPTGTLKFYYHEAYNVIKDNTGNRKKVAPILLGDSRAQPFGRLTREVMEFFDSEREGWLNRDKDPVKWESLRRELKELIIAVAAEERRDSDERDWTKADDAQYVDSAIDIFINDSLAWWMKRPEQKCNLLGVSESMPSRKRRRRDADPGGQVSDTTITQAEYKECMSDNAALGLALIRVQQDRNTTSTGSFDMIARFGLTQDTIQRLMRNPIFIEGWRKD